MSEKDLELNDEDDKNVENLLNSEDEKNKEESKNKPPNEEKTEKINEEKKENEEKEKENKENTSKDTKKEEDKSSKNEKTIEYIEDERKDRTKNIIGDDKVDSIISYFKKINIPGIANKKEDKYDIHYGWFYCEQTNEANGNKCELGKEICPKCMKKTQKIYNLKPHYLINSNGRICTYKKNKIYCLGKLQRTESENNSDEVKKMEMNYSIEYTCGHTGQCEPCKNLTKIMDKYFGDNLMKQLKKRDEKNLN